MSNACYSNTNLELLCRCLTGSDWLVTMYFFESRDQFLQGCLKIGCSFQACQGGSMTIAYPCP